MSDEDEAGRVKRLLSEHGQTFAEEAGIKLRNTPGPLYQLLVLSTLLSARIRSSAAVAAANELFKIGCTTPAGTEKTTWQQRVDALGRGGYRRYDESTSTALEEGVKLVQDRWKGDLRNLREEADRKPDAIQELLQEVPRIGPAGAGIFCREVQGLWPELQPWLDERALRGARENRLPTDPERLAKLVQPKDLPRLASALVRGTVKDG